MTDTVTATCSYFDVDDTYDREFASDGVSRYGHYLTSRLADFLGFYDDIVNDGEIDSTHPGWLAWCWQVASTPIMSPGYVRWRAPVLAASLYRDDWDGTLCAQIEVAAGLPVRLDGKWQTWHRNSLGDVEQPWRPPTALTQVTLTAPLAEDWAGPGRRVDPRVDKPAEITRLAQRSLRVTVRRFDQTFAAAINQLAGHTGAGGKP